MIWPLRRFVPELRLIGVRVIQDFKEFIREEAGYEWW